MSVYLTGDTHGYLSMNKLSSRNWPLGKSLGEDDYVIILGDFGLVWYPEEKRDKSERWWLDWLDNKPWTTLFIDGNHENFDRLAAFPVEQWHGGKVHCVSDKVIHLMRGEIFDICGNSFLAFGGARSPDRSFRVPGKTWWEREEPSDAEKRHCLDNLVAHGNRVDVILTHDAPVAAYDSMLSTIIQYPPSSLCYWLQTNIVEGAYFKRWYFGHHHRNLASPRYVCLYDDIVKLDLSCSDGATYRDAWEDMVPLS